MLHVVTQQRNGLENLRQIIPPADTWLFKENFAKYSISFAAGIFFCVQNKWLDLL